MPILPRKLAALHTESSLLPSAPDSIDAGPGASSRDGESASTPPRAGSLRARRARGQKNFQLKIQEPTEAQVMKAVKQALQYHQAVAWVERLNSGAGRLVGASGEASQWMRFAWVGAPDLIGQLKNGRLLAVEVKRPSGTPTFEQHQFLALVRRYGGVAFVARQVEDVFTELSLEQEIT